MIPPLIREAPKARPYWLFIAAGCLVPALLNAFSSYLNSRFGARGSADWKLVAFAGFIWLIFGALTPIIYALARRYPLRRERIVRTLLAHGAGALVFCVAWTSACTWLSLRLNLHPMQEPLSHFYLSWLLTNFPLSVILYFTVLGSVNA